MKSEVWGNGREFEEDGAGLEGTGGEVEDKEAEELTESQASQLVFKDTERSLSLLDCPVGIRR